jgi:hypothetical protein
VTPGRRWPLPSTSSSACWRFDFTTTRPLLLSTAMTELLDELDAWLDTN